MQRRQNLQGADKAQGSIKVALNNYKLPLKKQNQQQSAPKLISNAIKKVVTEPKTTLKSILTSNIL